MQALPLTGERTLPGIDSENYWFRRHEAAYEFLLPYAGVRWLLEIGCGEGYGAARFADVAARVIGLDYDQATVMHAATRYRTPAFLRANLAALPVRDRSVDVVAALQVIEHVWDHRQFLAECLRVLRPSGTLLVTTPNRLTFSPGRTTPVNPFHTHEFTAAELVGLLGAGGFGDIELFGLYAGPRLRELDARYGGSFADAQLATPPGRWSARLMQHVVGVTCADFVVSAANPDTALDLVAVARHAGI